jgi:hypothetical protein
MNVVVPSNTWKPCKKGNSKTLFSETITSSDLGFGIFLISNYRNIISKESRLGVEKKIRLTGDKLKAAIKSYNKWWKQIVLWREKLDDVLKIELDDWIEAIIREDIKKRNVLNSKTETAADEDQEKDTSEDEEEEEDMGVIESMVFDIEEVDKVAL